MQTGVAPLSRTSIWAYRPLIPGGAPHASSPAGTPYAASARGHDRIVRAPGRSFGSKVAALHQAQKLLDGLSYGYIGNLDADVTTDANYYSDLIAHFERTPHLGIAGGLVYEESNGVFEGRRSNRLYSVAHAGQLVRRECYEAIGGYAILQYGGEDWHAQISASI